MVRLSLALALVQFDQVRASNIPLPCASISTYGFLLHGACKSLVPWRGDRWWSLRCSQRGYRTKALRPTLFHSLTCLRELHFGAGRAVHRVAIVRGVAQSSFRNGPFSSRIIRGFASLPPSRLFVAMKCSAWTAAASAASVILARLPSRLKSQIPRPETRTHTHD